MQKLLKIGVVLACSSSIVSNAYASELSADQRFLYIGGEAGIVSPVKKSFLHKESGTDITLKKSPMYSAKLGYSFYPGMSVEFSASFHPTYKLGYKLAEKPIVGRLTGKTKVRTQVYMANVVYDFYNSSQFTPFVIVGAGISRVKVKPTISTFNGMEFFRVNKTVTNCYSWQAGIGVSTEVAPNFIIDLATKLQVAYNVKVKNEGRNPTTMQFERQPALKKTIGVAELGLGFTYKLPM